MVLGCQQARAAQHCGGELLLAVAFREWCGGNSLFFHQLARRRKENTLCVSGSAQFVAYNLCNYKKIYIFFSSRSKDTSMFIALWTDSISLKSFVHRNIAGNIE